MQGRLLREIFGNPFRPVALDPALLTWHDGTLPQLAQALYDDRHLPSGHLDNHRLAQPLRGLHRLTDLDALVEQEKARGSHSP